MVLLVNSYLMQTNPKSRKKIWESEQRHCSLRQQGIQVRPAKCTVQCAAVLHDPYLVSGRVVQTQSEHNRCAQRQSRDHTDRSEAQCQDRTDVSLAYLFLQKASTTLLSVNNGI